MIELLGMAEDYEKVLNKLLGVWLLVHEVADDFIRDSVKRSREKPEEKRTLLEELIVNAAKEKEVLRKDTGDVAVDTLSKAGLGTKEELEKLIERLNAVENKIKNV